MKFQKATVNASKNKNQASVWSCNWAAGEGAKLLAGACP